MTCKQCRYWTYVGESFHIYPELDVKMENDIGACSNHSAMDGVVKAEQTDSHLACQIILGFVTSLLTKDSFCCKYFEDKE